MCGYRMPFELYVLFTLSDNIECIEGKSETEGMKVKYQKDNISWWKKKKLVLTLFRYMSVSCLSFLTKRIDAERKWMAKERSAWRGNGEGNGPATVTCHSGWGLGLEGSGHKQGGESTYRLGHGWTLCSALHVLNAEKMRNYCAAGNASWWNVSCWSIWRSCLCYSYLYGMVTRYCFCC